MSICWPPTTRCRVWLLALSELTASMVTRSGVPLPETAVCRVWAVPLVIAVTSRGAPLVCPEPKVVDIDALLSLGASNFDGESIAGEAVRRQIGWAGAYHAGRRFSCPSRK